MSCIPRLSLLHIKGLSGSVSSLCVQEGSQDETAAGIHLSAILQQGLEEGEARRSKESTISLVTTNTSSNSAYSGWHGVGEEIHLQTKASLKAAMCNR